MTTESWQNTPHVSYQYEPDVTKFVEAFKKFTAEHQGDSGAKITFNAVLLKAIAEAIEADPVINAHMHFEKGLVRGKVTVFDNIDNAAAAAKVRESGADLLFVCLGAPKQEIFMRKYGEATGAHLLMGLGGSLDVFAGNVKRAPKIYQDLNLEWFYRLLKNPSRIGRMMKLPLFLIHVMGERK